MSQVTVVPVKLVLLPPMPNGELAEHVYRICDFCGKTSEMLSAQQRIAERLAPGSYHCSFCLRHRFHTKENKHTLVMSFRGVIGYYFYELCQNPHGRQKKMWVSEVKDFISSHAEVGLTNPLFSYDPETLLWFVDFARVGSSKKKLKVEEVLKTVVNILACFNMSKEIPGVRLCRFFNKFKEAILQFHTKRYRPPDRRLLIPTLSGCLSHEPKHLERTRGIIAEEIA
jgi:hypothetical protein